MKLDEFRVSLLERSPDQHVTLVELHRLEILLDQLYKRVGIDVELNRRHFIERLSDPRNGSPITIVELQRLFVEAFRKYNRRIAQLGPDVQAVLKDLQTDINIPFILQWDRERGELDLIAKTAMRKHNFHTPDRVLTVETIQDQNYTDSRIWGQLLQRMSEAADQLDEDPEDAGFDPQTTYYHGTASKSNFRKFKVGEGGINELGPGIYVTSKPDMAGWWAQGDGGRLLPVYLKKGEFYDLDMLPERDSDAYKKLMVTLAKRIMKNGGSDMLLPAGAKPYTLQSTIEYVNRLFPDYDYRNSILRQAGYIGAYKRQSQIPGQIVVFEPKNVRSKFAKFNPKKIDSEDILA